MATPLKKLYPVDAGEEIGEGKCTCCGGVVFWTVSKSGAVYWNCYNRRQKDNRPCQAHARWGGADSADMRRAYLVKTGKLAQVKVPKADNLNRAPIKAVEAPPVKPQATPDTPQQPTQPEAKKRDGYDEYGF